MPALDEIGAAAGSPARPEPQIIFVRLPADAPRPAVKTTRRSPAKGRRKRQEKKKMIKTALAIVLSLALYVVLGLYLPFLGRVAVTFPMLAAVPVVGAWACFLTFKGIAAMAAFSALSRKW